MLVTYHETHVVLDSDYEQNEDLVFASTDCSSSQSTILNVYILYQTVSYYRHHAVLQFLSTQDFMYPTEKCSFFPI